MDKYHKILTVFKRDPQNHFKTLLENQWAIPEFGYLAYNQWVYTEKIDGTNIRIGWNRDIGGVEFGGRTDNAQIPPFLLDKLKKMFPPEKLEEIWPDPEQPITLYGEGYGARIQKGGGDYISNDVSFILFDVKIGNWWLKRIDVQDIADRLKILSVPIIGKGTLWNGIEIVMGGFQSQIGNQIAEGLVMRPEIELFARNGERIITKVKYKDFDRNLS